jgi:hypothetical protein
MMMTRKYWKIEVIIVMLFFFGCSTTRNFKQLISAGRCQQAADELPHNLGLTILKETKVIGGTVVSYALTGATYTSEFLVKYVGGILVAVAICSPIIAIEAASNSTGEGSARCIGSIGETTVQLINKGKSWGSQVHLGTQDLRCPDLSSTIESISSLSACFEKDGTRTGLLMAKRHLDLLTNKDFILCTDPLRKEKIYASIQRIEERLATE